MEKTATLNLRVNPTVKEQAEMVLARLGVPMSTAIILMLILCRIKKFMPNYKVVITTLRQEE